MIFSSTSLERLQAFLQFIASEGFKGRDFERFQGFLEAFSHAGVEFWMLYLLWIYLFCGEFWDLKGVGPYWSGSGRAHIEVCMYGSKIAYRV